MKNYRLYGIEVGQVYAAADGAPGRLVVRDVTTYADVGDVVVHDERGGEERVIGAYKLARVSHYLVDFNSGKERSALVRALREGVASPEQQQRLAQLFDAQETTLQEVQVHARRGQFVVDNAEWRSREDPRDGKRTWLCVKVDPDADLSCKGTRAKALDDVMVANGD